MRISFLIFLSAILILVSFLYLRSGNVSEPDSLYHFHHAEIYRQTSPWTTSFPWTQYSVVNRFSSDIWYGFHLFLMPFTLAKNPVSGLKLSGIAITIAAILLFYWSLARLNVLKKLFWPFLFLFSSPYIIYRLAMARPHVLSLGLSSLFFSFLVSGNFWGIFFSSLALTFFHLSFFWAPLLIFLILAIIKIFTEKILEWRAGLAMLAGLFAGWVLRPNPLGAAKIAYEQIIQLLIEKQKGVPLRFGMELLPLPVKDLSIFAPFIILWSFAVLIFLLTIFRRGDKKEILPRSFTVLWASLIISALFFLMTMLVAQRSFDFWATFGVIFIAFVFSYFLDGKSAYKIANLQGRKIITTLGILIFVFMAAYGTYKQGKFLNEFGWDPYQFKPAADWIKNNSKPGEIIFNTSWDYFPALFFWNSQNYYINGMDPIFQYGYDPKLYWESYYFELGKATKFTCGKTSCGPKEVENTYTVLKRDFKASYIFLSKIEDKNLYDYLLTDSNFSSKYEDEGTAVFQLK